MIVDFLADYRGPSGAGVIEFQLDFPADIDPAEAVAQAAQEIRGQQAPDPGAQALTIENVRLK